MLWKFNLSIGFFDNDLTSRLKTNKNSIPILCDLFSIWFEADKFLSQVFTIILKETSWIFWAILKARNYFFTLMKNCISISDKCQLDKNQIFCKLFESINHINLSELELVSCFYNHLSTRILMPCKGNDVSTRFFPLKTQYTITEFVFKILTV